MSDVVKSTQSGKSFGDTRHLRTEGHHIHIQTLEYLMQIVKVYC